ncbi:MAG: nitrous oxide reductase accessory protein NosL [Flavobacteriales bacterium]|jgi:copper chaperone NosL|nr:nitrous oxide reductase accessory protein NosL [Flavobacteriales bacterium]
MIKYITLLFSFLVLVSCTIKPKPINYGSDHCRYCEMTVVDQNHASFYVTKKGKQFNFDSIECMINDLKDKDETQMAFINVNVFGQPTKTIEAQKATYLVSPAIKSPMGKNLSAFGTKETAQKTQQENGGNLYTWQQIKTLIKK